MRKTSIGAIATVGVLALAAASRPDRVGPCGEGEIYVTSQGLCYKTRVARDPLPMNGPFQLLKDGVTEFGPRDPGYRGGRWWEDLNNDGIQNEGDHFFLCPLMGPGHPPE
jgi:hypothetical protein